MGEVRVHDKVRSFDEDHPPAKKRSFNRWIKCDVCEREERGWFGYMWKLMTPKPLPQLCEDREEWAKDLPLMWPSWHIYYGSITVCSTCAPSSEDAMLLRRLYFFELDIEDVAENMKLRRKLAKEAVYQPGQGWGGRMSGVKVEKVKADWIMVSYYYGKNQFAATEAEARELCTQLLALGLGPEGNAIADFARRMLRREDAAEIAQAMRLLRAFEDMEAPEELGTLDLLAYLRASCARETGSHVFSEESEEI